MDGWSWRIVLELDKNVKDCTLIPSPWWLHWSCASTLVWLKRFSTTFCGATSGYVWDWWSKQGLSTSFQWVHQVLNCCWRLSQWHTRYQLPRLGIMSMYWWHCQHNCEDVSSQILHVIAKIAAKSKVSSTGGSYHKRLISILFGKEFTHRHFPLFIKMPSGQFWSTPMSEKPENLINPQW